MQLYRPDGKRPILVENNAVNMTQEEGNTIYSPSQCRVNHIHLLMTKCGQHLT